MCAAGIVWVLFWLKERVLGDRFREKGGVRRLLSTGSLRAFRELGEGGSAAAGGSGAAAEAAEEDKWGAEAGGYGYAGNGNGQARGGGGLLPPPLP